MSRCPLIRLQLPRRSWRFSIPLAGFLARLDDLLQVLLVLGQAIDKLDATNHIARTEQHGGQHKFLHRIGIGPGVLNTTTPRSV